jgi:hypothetical protein
MPSARPVSAARGAVAFAGHTGLGKSTLAAALARRGHGLIADDVCAIELAEPGPAVRPSFPRLRLWDDAMRALDLSPEGLPRASVGKPKFHYCQPGQFDPSTAPLRAIYLLQRTGDGQADAIERVRGAAAAASLSNEVYRRWIGVRLGRRPDLLTQALHVAAEVPVFRCRVRPDLTDIGEAAARVEAHASGP